MLTTMNSIHLLRRFTGNNDDEYSTMISFEYRLEYKIQTNPCFKSLKNKTYLKLML